MKKVMIGILILIPIIILFVVAMVSTIVSTQAWIAVDDMDLFYKGSERNADNITLSFADLQNGLGFFYNYFDVKVYPEKANRYSINWRIVGDVLFTDEEYEQSYTQYLEDYAQFGIDFDESYAGFEVPYGEKHGRYVAEIAQIINGKPYKPIELETEQAKASLKEEIRNDLKALVLPEVKPAVVMVDENGNEVETNTSSAFMVSSYCVFTLCVEAEHVSKIVTVTVSGYDVERVALVSLDGESEANLVVGQSMRLSARFTPIDSIVGYTQWYSNNEAVATVDANGVVTARGVGSAEIFVKASKYSTENSTPVYVESLAFTVNTQAGASSKYGNTVYTSNTSLTLEDLAILDASAIEGCEVVGNVITLTSDTATVDTQGGVLTIIRVESGSICIENGEFFNYVDEDSFALAVGNLTLKLKALWQDMLCQDSLENVVWTSSSPQVATVNANGEVLPKARGLVTITATYGDKSASVTINVQNKVASMQLKTSDASLAVGVARQTVFASDRYVDENVDNQKTANYTYLVIHGAPEDATKAELNLFYSLYTFEILSGGEFAHFDSVEHNKLIFDSEALEKQKRQDIQIRVSAKYPKYEGFTRFTTEEVTITAVYGVEVCNIKQLRMATQDQRDYVYREDNLISAYVDDVLLEENAVFDHTVESKGERYISYDSDTSLFNYAIVLTKNIAYEVDEEGNPDLSDEAMQRLSFFGDLYGNNHMISATKEQADKLSKLCQLAWGNTTFSNVILRAFNLGDDAVITDGSDTRDFGSECMIVENLMWQDHEGANINAFRMHNIVFEYCIFENAEKFAAIYNCDVQINGCILRNMSQCAIWASAEMMQDNDIDTLYYPRYSRVTTYNVVVSNSLGSFASFNYDDFVVYNKNDKGGGLRFCDTEEENKQYFLQHFASQGVNLVFHQRGFADIYNWVDVTNANILDTGNEQYNNYIRTFSGPLVKQNSAFAPCRVDEGDDEDNQTAWFHMGFVFCGTGGKGLVQEPIYTEIIVEDSRFHCIDTRELVAEGDSTARLGASVLSAMNICFYCYTSDNLDSNGVSIQPHMRYSVDSALIARLHT